jgi:xanthine dehydrogenase large subunit
MAIRDSITFRLNGETHVLHDVSPTLTLLNYLREDAALCGTKEGCAEGDCGACTVVIGELVEGNVVHRAVNACIQFIGMLEGKSVLTVEHLKAPGGQLHPVQQAMVDKHGSQCGFCTPGFVMSLYAAYVSGLPMDADSAPDLLAGNLCRCTGYGPIIAAQTATGDYPAPDWEATRLEDERRWLTDHAHDETIDFTANDQRLLSPGNLDDLAALYAENPDAILVSGATDVGLWVTKAHRKLGTMIHLGRVRELQTIQRDAGKLTIGAGVTLTDAMAIIVEIFPDFGEMIRRFGAVQVRNAGTIGGNIANGSPIGDTPPALIVLDATLVLRKGDGRRRLPIEEFFIDYGEQDRAPGEFLEAIEIPIPGPVARLGCYKLTKRFDQDISAVCGCFDVRVENGAVTAASIAFGGMAVIPKRARAIEAALVGKPWTADTVESAMAGFDEDFTPITDMRASAVYRMQSARNLLRKYHLETAQPLSGTRLVGRGATLGGARQDSSLVTETDGTDGIEGGVRTARRHDSAHKHVSGEAIFVDDIPAPADTLAIHVAMSERAHARILGMDLSAVEAADGVVCVISAADIPGTNDISPTMGDDKLFADSLVEYAGQSLFAVAAETLEAARAAAALAKIDYEDLAAIVTVDQAMDAESYLETPYVMARGDAAQAIKAAPHRLDGRTYIGGQEHFYLEGQVALAVPGEDGDVTVHCSTQHPSEIQHTVAKVLGLANHAVRVEVRRMGGAFGGKESNGNLPAAAAAMVAQKTGRAAKVCYDRDQDMIITGKRHDFRIDYRVGFDGDGLILGVEFDQAVRCGMSYDLSVPICDRAMFHADNSYYLANARITSYRCKTNTVSNTAFRGFGGPQGMIGIERVIDEIAHFLGKDPLAVRRANFYDPQGAVGERSVTPYDMTVKDCIIDDLVEELRKTADYDQRRADIRTWNRASGILKRGIALTPVKFGISFTLTFLNQAGALVHIYNDGSIHLNHGGTEMGQGLFTKVAQVVAESFQVDIDKVKITATNTAMVPNTSATAASSGSDLNGMAADDACRILKARLAKFAAERWQTTEDKVQFLPGGVRIGTEKISFEDLIGEAYRARVPLSATGFYATPKIHWDKQKAKGRPFFYFAYGAAVTEVAIDTLTGENRILRVDILHDVGKSLNSAIDLGQIEGGYVQGTGWLTTEELWWDDKGILKTHAPSTYKIPACGDRAPDMRINLWTRGENPEKTIYRSKAVGEPPLMLCISALMALSDAVAGAGGYTDYPALDAPATPERILAAVHRVSQQMEGAA